MVITIRLFFHIMLIDTILPKRRITNLQTLTLANLPLNKTAYINYLDLTGELRRRLLDLGFSAGNQVMPLFRSPAGDPTAYMIMGSVIAIRHDDAKHIFVKTPQKGEYM